jgi:Tol biopolymer transport system component
MRRSALFILCVLPFVPVAADAHGSPERSAAKIVFSSDARSNAHTAEIYSIRADGSQRRNLSRNPGYEESFAWSPTGDRIAFVADRPDDGGRGIYVMDADGSGQRRLTPPDLNVSPPTWSPDGRRLTFAASRGDSPSGIWVVGVDGSDLRLVAEGGHSPVWAPQGSLIAFVGRGYAWPLEVVDADSGSRRLVVGGQVLAAPTWSPDAQELAFVHNNAATGNEGLYKVNAGGGEPQVLVPSGDIELGDPAWSPRGTSIAFSDRRRAVIDAVDAVGGAPKVLGAGARPVWSPDGDRIAFATDSGIHVMDADGGHRRKVQDEKPALVTAGPAWSPDGETLLFASRQTKVDDEIFVVNPDGSGLHRLTSNNVDDVQPSWSPGHTRIAYARDPGPSIWVMSATGRNKQRLAAGTHPSWSPDGSQLAFQRGSAVYTLSDRGRRVRRIVRGERPAWAPRGKRIAFVRGTKLFTVNTRTGFVWLLADLACEPVGEGGIRTTLSSPDWSPAANRLVVAVTCETSRFSVVNALIVDAYGRGAIGNRVPIDPVSDSRIAWSPAGAQLAFAAGPYPDLYGVATISTAQLDGSVMTAITPGAGFDHDPDW